jgi:hypothetical protein
MSTGYQIVEQDALHYVTFQMVRGLIYLRGKSIGIL